MEEIEVVERIPREYEKASPSRYHLQYGSSKKVNLGSRMFYIFQNYLSVFTSVLILSHLLSTHFCVLKEDVGRAEIMSTLFFGVGIPSLLIHLFTSNYIVVGNLRFGYFFSCLLLLQSELTCPGNADLFAMGPMARTKERIARVKELQGTMICVSIIHLLIGGTVHKWIHLLKPVTVAPTLIIAGLAIAKTNAINLATHGCWLLFITTVCVILIVYYITNRRSLTSEYRYSCNGRKLCVGLIGSGLVWTGCAILSTIGITANTSARTDIYNGIFDYIKDYSISYPLQFGLPEFQLKSIAIVCPAVLVSIFEAVADCYKRYEISETNKMLPARDLRNRIFLEGLCTLLSSVIGIGIGINVDTKSSRYSSIFSGKMIESYGSMVLILIAFSGTLCAFFSTMPHPIMMALIFLAFGSLLIEGIGIIRLVRFEKRNVYILGISIFVGIVVPEMAQEAFDKEWAKYFFRNGSFLTAITSFILDFTLSESEEDSDDRSISQIEDSSKSEDLKSESAAVEICECFSSFFA